MATTSGYGSQRVRRLSSIDATRADLYGGPNVVVPPKHLMASSEAHDTAIEMAMAKQHLEEEVSSEEESPRVASPIAKTTRALTTADEFALAFDIDGVLIRGGQAIPEAVDALKYINGQNPYGVKMYVFLPNKPSTRHNILTA
jgi:hypothetical protein